MSRLPIRNARRDNSRGRTLIVTNSFRRAAIALLLGAAVFKAVPAFADNGFPFGLDMTLDVAQQPGSKRGPNMEVGGAGRAGLELSSQAGKDQFSVPGNPLIFVP